MKINIIFFLLIQAFMSTYVVASNINISKEKKLNCSETKNHPNSLYRKMMEEFDSQGPVISKDELLRAGTSYYLSQNLTSLIEYKDINIPEALVIKKYNQGVNTVLNMYLWSDGNDGVTNYISVIKTLCNGLSKMPVHKGKVYGSLNHGQDLTQLKIGDTWRNKVFINAFPQDNFFQENESIKIIIQSKSARKMGAYNLYDEDFIYGNDGKVVFLPYSRFEIVSRKTEYSKVMSKNIHIIELRELDEVNDSTPTDNNLEIHETLAKGVEEKKSFWEGDSVRIKAVNACEIKKKHYDIKSHCQVSCNSSNDKCNWAN